MLTSADILGPEGRIAGRLGDYEELAERAFSWTLRRQRQDGSFPFSFGDYLLLSDNRSYPATMAMTLFHLAAEVGIPYIIDDPLRGILTNVVGTEVVLEAAELLGVAGRP